MVRGVPSMWVVWCASSNNARWLMRATHSSDSVAASRKPRARSSAVNPAVMVLVIEKRGTSTATSELAAKGPVLEGGEEFVETGEGRALQNLELFERGSPRGERILQ